eukprot:Lankesteria_metandrocarpae@DN3583_c0_g1_i3.p1
MKLFNKYEESTLKANLQLEAVRAQQMRSKNEAKKLTKIREICVFLQNNQELEARMRAEDFVNLNKLNEALGVHRSQIALVVQKMPLIGSGSKPPDDLVLLQALHSIVFAHAKLGGKELAVAVEQLEMKFGSKFVKSAAKNSRKLVHPSWLMYDEGSSSIERDVLDVLESVAVRFCISWVSPSPSPGLQFFSEMSAPSMESIRVPEDAPFDSFIPKPAAY